MIQETVARLLPAAPAENFWIITNGDLRPNIARQLKQLPRKQIVAEPVGRNTAPAIGLAAFILHRQNPEAVLGLFPSDQVIEKQKQFRKDLQTGIALAAAGENIVVMGVKPTRPETGYGYVEAGAVYQGEVMAGAPISRKAGKRGCGAVSCRRKFLLEQRDVPLVGQDAGECLAAISAGNRRAAGKNRGHLGHPRASTKHLRRLYRKCEDKSVDYAILEPRSACGEKEFEYLLHSGRLGMERPGFLGSSL